MARGFGMTALRSALGGVEGGLRGYRESQEDRAKEAERKRIVDAAIRAERDRAFDRGYVRASQYNPRGIAGGMDMPGATPRTPFDTQVIGGEKFVLPESKDVREHREGIFKQKRTMAEQEALGDIYETTGLAPKGQGRMVARMPTSAQQIALNAVQAAERARREASEFDRRERVRAGRTRAEGGTRAGGGEATPRGPEFENTKYTALERALSRAEDALRDAEEGSPEQAALRERVRLLSDNLTRVQEEQGIVRQPPPTPDAIPAGARFGGSYRMTDEREMQEAIKAVQDDPDLTFEEKLEAMREIQAAAAARRRQPRTP